MKTTLDARTRCRECGAPMDSVEGPELCQECELVLVGVLRPAMTREQAVREALLAARRLPPFQTFKKLGGSPAVALAALARLRGGA